MQQRQNTETLVQEYLDKEVTVTGVESRKRFYEETKQEEVVYQPKRGFFSSFGQMIRHPIEYFKPKQQKIGEITFDVVEDRKTQNVTITITTNDKNNLAKKQQKETQRVITINKDSDIEEKMKGVSYELINYLVYSIDYDNHKMISSKLQEIDEHSSLRQKIEENQNVVDGIQNQQVEQTKQIEENKESKEGEQTQQLQE